MRKKETIFYRKKCCLAFILLCIMVFPAFSAEISVPLLEAAARGRGKDGEFILSSAAAVDIALSSGYKYDLFLGFSFASDNLGKALAYRNFGPQPIPEGNIPARGDYNGLADRMNNQVVFTVKTIRATVRNFLNMPLDFSFFWGTGDFFCSGDDFSPRFGLIPIGTEYRGFFYFPEGIGGDLSRQYRGVYGAQGMGFSLDFTYWDFITPILYLYQDFLKTDPGDIFGKGRLAADLRLLFNGEQVQVEVFSGVSLSRNRDNSYRGGVMAFLSSSFGVDFQLQCGIPGWKGGEKFTIDHLYFLMEPRVDFGFIRLFLTFFYHPLQYLSITTGEEWGKADVNIKFLTGNLLRYGIEGGVETTMGLTKGEDFFFCFAPLLSFFGGGIRWDFKVRLNPLSFARPAEIFEFFMGMRMAY
jgi:hypothetical protein